MSDQPTPPPAQPRDPSRFIPLIMIGFALCLVIMSSVITRRIDAENKDFELNVTKTIQAQIEIATGTAQAIMTLDAGTSTPVAEATATPTP
jgi:hypothetical protein